MTALTTGSILRDTYELVRRHDEDVMVDRAVTGPNVILVSCRAGGHTVHGVAHSPDDTYPDVAGGRADEVLARALDPDANPADRALGIAILNALSADRIEWQSGDPMASPDPSVDAIGMVGLFGPTLKNYEDIDVRVIERFPEEFSVPSGLSPDVTVDIYGPADAETAFDGVSVIYVTGSTLIYGGLGEYLAVAPQQAEIVLVGTTSSFLPDRLFEAGVDVVGGVEVTDADAVTELVRAGAPVPKLHRNGLAKGVVRADNTPTQ